MNETNKRYGPFEPDYVIPPGETLAELLDERDLSQTDLARRLGVSLKHVNQVIKGSASISADLALGLETVLGVSADFWLTRESIYRANLARHERRAELAQAVDWAKQFPLSDLRKRKLISPDAEGPDLVDSLLRFFGVATPTQMHEPSVAFRKSLKFNSDPNALRAWLRWGEIKASQLLCEPYDERHFNLALEEIRGLTRLERKEWDHPFTSLCASAGVAVVITPTFSKVRANGATWWASPHRAVIQLSLRYKWEDVFWFSFFHEAAHVLLHRKKQVFIEPEKESDLASVDPTAQRLEQEANRFASQTLIPPKYDSQLLGLDPGDSDAVRALADRLGISAAIVVGRLMHDTRIYNRGNELRRRFDYAID